jgi:hypothetical protein
VKSPMGMRRTHLAAVHFRRGRLQRRCGWIASYYLRRN